MYICSLHCFSICVNSFPQKFQKRVGFPSSFLHGMLAMHPFFLVEPPDFPVKLQLSKKWFQIIGQNMRFQCAHETNTCEMDHLLEILLYGVELFQWNYLHPHWLIMTHVYFEKYLHWYLSLYKDQIICTLYICMHSFNRQWALLKFFFTNISKHQDLMGGFLLMSEILHHLGCKKPVNNGRATWFCSSEALESQQGSLFGYPSGSQRR